MDTLVSTFSQTYQSTSTMFWAYAPRMLVTLVAVLSSLLATRLAKATVLAILEALRLDHFAKRFGAAAALRRADVHASLSEIIAQLVYWMGLLFTCMVGMNALDIAHVKLVKKIGAMVPDVITASVILILGLNLAGFVSKLIQTASVNAEVTQARMARHVAHYGMCTFVMVHALRQLGLPEKVLMDGFTILLGSAGLGLAVAFGLGARDLAGTLISSSWARERARSQALAEASNLGREVIPGAERSSDSQSVRPRGRPATSTS